MTIYLAAPLDVKPAEKSILDEGVNEGVNEGVQNLISLIEDAPGKRTPFFSQRLGTSVKNIERWLKQLKDREEIEFRGAPKTGGYFVRQDNK
jgi:ATP-dependent DNA helicase RecG